MTKAKFRSLIIQFSPLIAIAAFVLLWYIAALAVNAEIILPKPSLVIKDLFLLFGKGTFWGAVGGTLMRAVISFAISLVLAACLATIGFAFKPVHKALMPIVTIVRATPTMSIILLSLIWLTSKTAPMLIGCLIIFPMLYADFYSALSNIDGGLIDMAKLYKVSGRDIVTKLYIPNTLPSFLDAVRSGISLNVKVVIAGEVIAQTRQSMGMLMQISRTMLDTASLLAWTIAAIVISYLLEVLVAIIKKYAVRWRRQ